MPDSFWAIAGIFCESHLGKANNWRRVHFLALFGPDRILGVGVDRLDLRLWKSLIFCFKTNGPKGKAIDINELH